MFKLHPFDKHKLIVAFTNGRIGQFDPKLTDEEKVDELVHYFIYSAYFLHYKDELYNRLGMSWVYDRLVNIDKVLMEAYYELKDLNLLDNVVDDQCTLREVYEFIKFRLDQNKAMLNNEQDLYDSISTSPDLVKFLKESRIELEDLDIKLNRFDLASNLPLTMAIDKEFLALVNDKNRSLRFGNVYTLLTQNSYLHTEIKHLVLDGLKRIFLLNKQVTQLVYLILKNHNNHRINLNNLELKVIVNLDLDKFLDELRIVIEFEDAHIDVIPFISRASVDCTYKTQTDKTKPITRIGEPNTMIFGYDCSTKASMKSNAKSIFRNLTVALGLMQNADNIHWTDAVDILVNRMKF